MHARYFAINRNNNDSNKWKCENETIQRHVFYVFIGSVINSYFSKYFPFWKMAVLTKRWQKYYILKRFLIYTDVRNIEMY